MPFPVVKKCANVTHVFDSAGNIRLPQVYKPIIILMYHLSFRFLENFQPKSVSSRAYRNLNQNVRISLSKKIFAPSF